MIAASSAAPEPPPFASARAPASAAGRGPPRRENVVMPSLFRAVHRRPGQRVVRQVVGGLLQPGGGRAEGLRGAEDLREVARCRPIVDHAGHGDGASMPAPAARRCSRAVPRAGPSPPCEHAPAPPGGPCAFDEVPASREAGSQACPTTAWMLPTPVAVRVVTARRRSAGCACQAAAPRRAVGRRWRWCRRSCSRGIRSPGPARPSSPVWSAPRDALPTGPAPW